MHACACMLAGHKCLDLSPEQEDALIAESASHKKAKGVDAAAIRSAVCLCLGCLKLLTTGPDLPIMPLGPGGPLIASCGAEKAEFSTLTAFFFFSKRETLCHRIKSAKLPAAEILQNCH